MRFSSRRLVAAAVMMLALQPIGEAAAQAGKPISLELNRLEARDTSCRAYLMVRNAGPAMKSLKIDLFALDADGIAAKRVALELGPISEGKTMIRLFDLTDLTCARVGRLLLNDIIACETDGGPQPQCLSAIETSAKGGAVPFDK
jgi:hypothetical protein